MTPIMAATAIRPPVAPKQAEITVTALKILFLPRAAAGAKVRREFTQPRRVVGVEEGVELADLPATKPWPEPTDHCVVVFVPKGCPSNWAQNAGSWLIPPDQPEAVPALSVE